MASHPDPYPVRIVTFVDILGFTRDVMKLDQGLHLYPSIDAVLRHVANCKRDIDRKRQQTGNVRFDHRVTQFSDCILMSYANEPGASLRAIADAAFIGQVILRPGYLPRGAITLERLVHDDAVTFGKGLICAHHLESRVIGTPRIAVSTEVLDLVRADLTREQPGDRLDMYVRDRGSGPFVHILGQDWPFLREIQERFDKASTRMTVCMTCTRKFTTCCRCAIVMLPTDEQGKSANGCEITSTMRSTNTICRTNSRSPLRMRRSRR